MFDHKGIKIPFKVNFVLQSKLINTTIKIDTAEGTTFLQGNDKKEINIGCVLGDNDKIPMLTITGFQPDPLPEIFIKEMKINGYDVEDFKSLLSFDMKGNKFVKDERIDAPDSITFNGCLNLDVERNRDRLTWFPVNYSTSRKFFHYSNIILNCQSEYGCYEGNDCRHDPPWKIFNLDEFTGHRNNFDLVAVGCSFTAGMGILKDRSWPGILKNDFKQSTLNLGVPGIGHDGILNNVKRIISSDVDFKKMIILLPSINRRSYTIERHNLYFNFISRKNIEITERHFNIFFDKNELEEIIKSKHRKFTLNFNPKRNVLIIKRLIRLLESSKTDYYISSWSDEVYDIVRGVTPSHRLLPMFNEDQDESKGKDREHPAESIHEKWVKSIENQIGTGK